MFPSAQTHTYSFSAHEGDAPRYSYEGELKKAIAIADFYGFNLVSPLSVSKEDREHERRHHCPAHNIAALRTFVTNDISEGNTVRVALTRKVPYKDDLELRLEIIGDRESSAEGLLFQTIQSILHEYGYKNLTVRINSVGGRDEVATFSQAVAAHFRTRLGELETSCREAFKESVLAPLRCSHQKCIAARAGAPQSLAFLYEPGRAHFKEVLEYLESLDLPYALDPTLVGSEHYTSRTVFSFGEEPQADALFEPLVYGERYDHLARRVGFRRGIPALSATFSIALRSPKEKYVALKRTQRNAPVFVVQVGLQAKIQTLRVGESLRRAHIRIETALHQNSVAEQMEHARRLGAPLLVIIGHREVCEGTALVRHIMTNQQDSIPLATLPLYLKSRMKRIKR
jgi:histidyl-tRNA synthetase